MIDPAAYHHRCVRDLAWAICSPPLLEPRHRGVFWPGPSWYRDRYEEYAPTLALLDKDPATLDAAIADRNPRNLGGYFESLLAFWLGTTPRFRLVGRKVTVRDNGRTVGESNLLVRDIEAGRSWCIESAVEFFLGYPSASGRARHHWLGVNASENLDDKVRHLRRRQTRSREHPAGRARLDVAGIEVDRVMVVLKGRLFYPHRPKEGRYGPPHGAGAGHLHGTWYTAPDFVATFADTPIEWMVPDRMQWLSPHRSTDPPGELLHSESLATTAGSSPVAAIGWHRGAEVQRCFVVPGDWPRLDRGS